jgi:hypothetical protein
VRRSTSALATKRSVQGMQPLLVPFPRPSSSPRVGWRSVARATDDPNEHGKKVLDYVR